MRSQRSKSHIKVINVGQMNHELHEWYKISGRTSRHDKQVQIFMSQENGVPSYKLCFEFMCISTTKTLSVHSNIISLTKMHTLVLYIKMIGKLIKSQSRKFIKSHRSLWNKKIMAFVIDS